jgi:hypothetical protein
LHAAQYTFANHEQRNALDPDLLVGVTQSGQVSSSILATPQRLLELLLIQTDLSSQRCQHADIADVPPLAKERLQYPVVVFIGFAVLLGVLEALERQVGVRLGRDLGQHDGHPHPTSQRVDRLGPSPLEVLALRSERRVWLGAKLERHPLDLDISPPDRFG